MRVIISTRIKLGRHEARMVAKKKKKKKIEKKKKKKVLEE